MADRRLFLDPDPDDTLEKLWSNRPRVARAIEDALDWIEQDPPDPRARRRRFSNGMWAITRLLEDEEWLVVWEETEPGRAVVRHIGETTSL